MANRKVYETIFELGAKVKSSVQTAFGSLQKYFENTRRQTTLSNRSVLSLNASLKSLTGIMAGFFSLRGAMDIGRTMFDNASSLQDYRTTLNVTMKDQKKAAQTMRWAVDFANKTPYETEGVVEATVKLQNYGIQAKKTLPIIGDMASVMKKDLIDAVEAVADAQTGELERLKEFGVTKKMIADQGRKMRMAAFINNKGQITDQEKFNKALFGLMKERFSGGMVLQSRNFRGVMSTITGVWNTSLAQMAGMAADGTVKQGSLFDVVQKKAAELGDTLVKLSSDGTIEKLSQKIGNIAQKALDFADGVIKNWPKIAPIVETLTVVFIANKVALLSLVAAEKAGLVITALSKAWGTATAVLSLMREGYSLATIAQMQLNVAMSANPIGLIIIGITALVTAGYFLIKNWDAVKNWFINFWNNGPLNNKYVQGALMIFAPFIGLPVVIIKNWDKISAFFKNLWAKIGPIFKAVGDFFVKVFGGGNKKATIQVRPPSKSGKNTISSVPQYARGTGYHPGGWAITGERGPELVNLPRGSRVTPNNRTESFLNGLGGFGNGGINITFAPQIDARGNPNPEAINQAVDVSYQAFERNMDTYLRRKIRLNFAG